MSVDVIVYSGEMDNLPSYTPTYLGAYPLHSNSMYCTGVSPGSNSATMGKEGKSLDHCEDLPKNDKTRHTHAVPPPSVSYSFYFIFLQRGEGGGGEVSLPSWFAA